MALIQIIYLTQGNFGVHPTVHAVQNDTGRLLKMVVRDIVLSSGSVGGLYFKRSDGTYYNTTAELDLTDNAFTADMTQALTQAGDTRCNLTVTDSNNKTVSSYPFLIIVHESQDGTSEAQLGYSIEEITEIIAEAEAVAGTGRLWSSHDVYLLRQVLEHLKYDSESAGAIAEELLESLESKPEDQGWSIAQIDLLDSLLSHVKYTDAEGGDYADALIASLKGQAPEYVDADEVEY